MKRKKSLIAIITLLLVVAVGTTFAYYTSSAVFTNIFNTGTYRIVTTEVFESPSNWAPGEEIPKTITSTNEGTVPATVRVSYVEKWEDLQGTDITSQVNPNPAIINLDHTNYWIKEGNYYYYKYILDPQQTTKSFIKSVTLNSDLNSVECTASQDGLTQDCSATSSVFGATYKLIITKETVQADKYENVWNTQVEITEKPQLIQLMNNERDIDNLEVGDEICINGETTECFNFIRYDGENDDNIVLLSKYNLKVGNIYNSSGTKTGEYSSSDTGYGLQSSDMKGYVSGQNRYGTVVFSGTNYWYSGGLKQKYGSSYNTSNIYDNDYSVVSGNNYSLAYYVENYKDILETYGLTIEKARLLTYGEALTNVGCSSDDYNCPGGFITSTSFWLGTAYNDSRVFSINSSGAIYFDNYYNNGNYGVRPVIVISKEDI